jgi:hypothetical protein
MSDSSSSTVQQVVYVSRTLARGKTLTDIAQGFALTASLPHQFTGLGLIEYQNETVARSLYQNGHLLYLCSGELEQRAALESLQNQRFDLRGLTLDPLSMMALAAATTGTALELGNNRVIEEIDFKLELKKQGFRGIVMLEMALRCVIWNVTPESIEVSGSLEVAPRRRVTRLAWTGEMPSISMNSLTDTQDSLALTQTRIGSTQTLEIAPEGSTINQNKPTASQNEYIWQALERILRVYVGNGAVSATQKTRRDFEHLGDNELIVHLHDQLRGFGDKAVESFKRDLQAQSKDG